MSRRGTMTNSMSRPLRRRLSAVQEQAAIDPSTPKKRPSSEYLQCQSKWFVSMALCTMQEKIMRKHHFDCAFTHYQKPLTFFERNAKCISELKKAVVAVMSRHRMVGLRWDSLIITVWFGLVWSNGKTTDNVNKQLDVWTVESREFVPLFSELWKNTRNEERNSSFWSL